LHPFRVFCVFRELLTTERTEARSAIVSRLAFHISPNPRFRVFRELSTTERTEARRVYVSRLAFHISPIPSIPLPLLKVSAYIYSHNGQHAFMLLTPKAKTAVHYCLLLLPYLAVLLAPYAPPVQWATGVSFLAITVCAAAGIINDPAPYSINKIYWIFNLIFFGVIPTYQYRIQHMAWEQHFRPETFLYANAVLLAGFAMYGIVRWMILKRNSASTNQPEVKPDKRFIDNYYFTGNIVFILCCTALILVYGLDNLWLRRMADSAALQMNSTVFLLLDKTLRGAVIYFTLLTVWLYRRRYIGRAQLLWILLVCIVVNFPLAVPRYFVATLYLSLLLTAGFRILKQRYFFSYALILLILIAFPLWSLTRLYLRDATALLSDVQLVYKDAVSYGDFDPYTSLCRTIVYVQANGITWGHQLLGVLLFFVPRTLWPGKPVGSGALVYEPIGVGFRNIASPYVAEGLINFGIIGVLFFKALLAFTAARYDRFYQSRAADFRYAIIFYPVAMIMVFFVLRGDLLSSFAYLTGFFVSGGACHILLQRIKTKSS
jgi:hypothetical protein